MNGKVARRIRRAALHILVANGTGEDLKAIRKRLKREYRARPYHKRNPTGYGYVSESHGVAERRWIDHMKF